jgi:hypothetical protein
MEYDAHHLPGLCFVCLGEKNDPMSAYLAHLVIPVLCSEIDCFLMPTVDQMKKKYDAVMKSILSLELSSSTRSDWARRARVGYALVELKFIEEDAAWDPSLHDEFLPGDVPDYYYKQDRRMDVLYNRFQATGLLFAEAEKRIADRAKEMWREEQLKKKYDAVMKQLLALEIDETYPDGYVGKALNKYKEGVERKEWEEQRDGCHQNEVNSFLKLLHDWRIREEREARRADATWILCYDAETANYTRAKEMWLTEQERKRRAEQKKRMAANSALVRRIRSSKVHKRCKRE